MKLRATRLTSISSGKPVITISVTGILFNGQPILFNGQPILYNGL